MKSILDYLKDQEQKQDQTIDRLDDPNYGLEVLKAYLADPEHGLPSLKDFLEDYLADSTYGLNALKNNQDTNKTLITDTKSLLSNSTYGLQAIKNYLGNATHGLPTIAGYLSGGRNVKSVQRGTVNGSAGTDSMTSTYLTSKDCTVTITSVNPDKCLVILSPYGHCNVSSSGNYISYNAFVLSLTATQLKFRCHSPNRNSSSTIVCGWQVIEFY